LTLTPHRHHLAPISGTIDPADASPLAAAWREIAEETTLTPASLSLLRQGKSYTFRDPSVSREWTVFPFLFRLRTPADEQRIRIDWEHEGWG
jgi:8-oxo-dGTP pyrophosphatase MutT (NUDIX family)